MAVWRMQRESVRSMVDKHLRFSCSSFPSSSHHRLMTQGVRIFQINKGPEMGLAISWRLKLKGLLEQKMTYGAEEVRVS